MNDIQTIINVVLAVVAVWGATLSTYHQIWVIRQSRPSVHMQVLPEYITDSEVRRLDALTIQVANTGNQPLPVAYIGFVRHRLLRRSIWHPGYPSRRHDPVTLKPGEVIEVRFRAGKVAKTFTEAGYSGTIRLRPYTLLVTRRRFDGKTYSLSLSEIASDDTSQA